MRNGQKAVINKAIKNNFREEVIELLHDESFPLWVYKYIYCVADYPVDIILKGIQTIRKAASDYITPDPRYHYDFFETVCKYYVQLSNCDNDTIVYLFFNKEACSYALRTGDVERITNNIPSREKELYTIAYMHFLGMNDCQREYTWVENILKLNRMFYNAVSHNGNVSKDFVQYHSSIFRDNDEKLEEQSSLLELSFTYDMPYSAYISNDFQRETDPQRLKYLATRHIYTAHEEYWGAAIRHLFPSFSFDGDKEPKRMLRFKTKEEEQKYKIVVDNHITGEIHLENYETVIFQKEDLIFICFKTSPTINVFSDYYFIKTKRSALNLMLTKDGNIFYKLYTGKFVPLTLKQALCFGRSNPYLLQFIKGLFLENARKGNYIAKDIIPYIESGHFLIPASINDILRCHNIKELVGKYKIWHNPNTSDLNVVYSVSKLMRYVNDRSKAFLRNFNDSSIFDSEQIAGVTSFSKSKNGLVVGLLTQLLYKRVLESGTFINAVTRYAKNMGIDPSRLTGEDITELKKNVYGVIKDYVRQCIELSIPVNLMFKSYRSIQDEHRRLTEEIGIKNFKKEYSNNPLVRKDSKYADLRKILPEDFEQIKTKDRLALESELMHHCVYSYADEIRKDLCAIYSYVKPGTDTRFTLEFRQKRDTGEYYLNQIQKKYDRGGDKTVEKYIRELLDNSRVM